MTPHRPLGFTSRPLPALQGIDTTGRVIYIGTFSKVLFASLRTGYCVVPHELPLALQNMRDVIDGFGSTIVEGALSEFINLGLFQTHLSRLRKVASEKREYFLTKATQQLGDYLRFHDSDAGIHIVATLSVPISDWRLSQELLRDGIEVIPLSKFPQKKPSLNGLIFGFAPYSKRQLDNALYGISKTIRRLL